MFTEEMLDEMFAEMCERDGYSTWWEAEEAWERYEAEITALSAPYSPKKNVLRGFIGKDVETLYKGFTAEEKRLFWRSIVKNIRMDRERNITVDYL